MIASLAVGSETEMLPQISGLLLRRWREPKACTPYMGNQCVRFPTHLHLSHCYSADINSLSPFPFHDCSCYGIAFAYVGADVAYVGYTAQKEGKPNNEVARAVVQASLTQLHPSCCC